MGAASSVKESSEIEFGHNDLIMSVVYFYQCLGAAHPKRWSKFSFSAFVVLKSYVFLLILIPKTYVYP